MAESVMTGPVMVGPAVNVVARKQVSIAPQHLILILFAIVITYLFLSGGKADMKTQSSGTPAPAPSGATLPRSDSYASLPNTASTLSNPSSPRLSTPGTGSTIPNPPSARPVNPLLTGPQLDLDGFLEHPERLRNIDPNAIASKGILKRPGGPKRGKSIGWIENSSGNVLSHPDNVLEDGEMDANQGEINPGWKAAPKGPGKQAGRHDWSQFTLKNLFHNVKVPRSVMERLWQIEWIAHLESRGEILGPQEVEGKDIGDPGKDTWDPVWGNLPQLGYEAAILISGMFEKPELVKTIQECMKERQKHPSGSANPDTSRRWSGFVERTMSGGKGEVTPERLCVGWFADTYRCIDTGKRMTITNQPIPMFQRIGPPARGLLWLETIARHFWRQRMFSEKGLDLDGLATRLAIPAKKIPKRNPEDANEQQQYEYSLELHIFMWGGPVEADSELIDWYGRMWQADRSLTTARIELTNTFFQWGHDETLVTICKRRRIIFRPGYTLHGINLSKAINVNTAQSHIVPIDRNPIVVVYPEDIWSPIGHIHTEGFSLMNRIIQKVHPQEVSIFNLRQYQWNTKTITKDNNRLSDLHLLAIMWAVGPNLSGKSEHGEDAPEIQSIRRIDFSAFIPIVKTAQTARDNSKQHVFFPLKKNPNDRHMPESSYISLSEIVIPFRDVDRNNPDGVNTVNLLLDPAFGLRPEIEAREIKFGNQLVDHHLDVYVTVPGTAGADALSDRVTRYMMGVAADHINSQPRNNRQEVNRARGYARAMAKNTYATVLKRIKVVDGSTNGDTSALKAYLTGEPLKVIDPSKWPADYQDLP